MLSFLPEDIRGRVLLLFLGAVLFFIGAVIVFKKRRNMQPEVWIALLSLCVIGTLCCLALAVCTSALFVSAQ